MPLRKIKKGGKNSKREFEGPQGTMKCPWPEGVRKTQRLFIHVLKTTESLGRG